MTAPYWQDADGGVQLYLGDMREVLPAFDVTADLIVADPPYAETSLAWDRWPDGWPALAATVTSSMWCFGSMRMFLDRRDDFTAWRLSHDVIWHKNAGSGMHTDRFRRYHESVTHWYRGRWSDLHHLPPRVPGRSTSTNPSTPQTNGPVYAKADRRTYTYDGTVIHPSVIAAKRIHKTGIHPSQKPTDLLRPLIEYGCPPDGLVIDPFAGSGSTLEAARLTGRRAIGIERHEPYAEAAAKRLAQAPLELA
jgi:site-specific DNA-methyltransferase (adenine-specific)